MLIFSLLFILLSNAVTLRRDKSILYSRIAITTLVLTSYIALENLNITSLSKGIGLYGGLFQATALSHTFQIFIYLISAAILQLTGFYPRKVLIKEQSSIYKLLTSNLNYNRPKIINKMGEQFKIIEYPLILLFIIIGATFLISSSDIVSIFLSIELQSYGLYLLATLYRNSELATSAGLTYFLLGGLSSCFILLGTSLLYANSGTTSLDGFYVITSLSDIAQNNSEVVSWYKANYINFSLLIMSVGFLFKIGAAPFHFWSPDVYDAIPTIVTTFVAIIAKISIFIFLLEIVHYTSNSYFSLNFNWTSGLLVSSMLSLIVGTILGLNQFRIKRLLAYSTISHLGFILLALSINSLESIQAFIFYLMQYSISNLNAFILLISIGFTLYPYINKNNENLQDKNNSPIQLITQLTGYFSINPVIALSFAITLYSFVGIPPLIGFFAKQMVLSAALDNGYVFLTLIAILTSVISAVYYLSVVKQIFFEETEHKLKEDLINTTLKASVLNKNMPEEKITFNVQNITLSSVFSITISILTLIILLFIFNPQGWLSMANILALIIFNS
jgi:NADH-ubiquinone oxidoreductase chain 2